MKLFSKLKDYNNLLEEILDQKTFSSIAKSLLLSMIYKLEIAYKDYAQVNVNCVEKDIFLSNLLNVIKKYCEHIKTVEPESVQAKLLIENHVEAVTNAKERSILSYPTEQAMLYAVCDIEPKYFFVKKDFPFKNILQKALVDGYKQNTCDILKNFNGWSWDIDLKEKRKAMANLIYQNVILIKGEQFLYDWRTDNHAKKDYLEELRCSIQKVTGNDDYYNCFCKLLAKIKEKDESQYETAVELQKYFLKFLEKKITRLVLREEIVEIIYQLRFYQNIVFLNNVFVKDCKELKKALDRTLKLAITKACKMGVIKIISMDIETNFKLIKYILDTRIIDLEEIKIYLEFENQETIFLKVYDKEVFEKQASHKFNGNKKDIVIKSKKITKLFN